MMVRFVPRSDAATGNFGRGVKSWPEKKAKKVCDHVLIGDFNEVFSQLPQNYFDCVIFNDVEHIYSPWDTVRDVNFLLSPTGVLVSSIPNFRYISNLITEILFEGEFV